MEKLSVIIPARNEIYLEKTLLNVLENARGDIEILTVLDGYKPDPEIKIDDNRLKFIYNETSIGQRQAINQAARQASGNYMMKLDAHCAVDEGFDVKLIADCQPDWTVIPRMYNLDITTWTPKHIDNFAMAMSRRKVTDYMYIGWNDKNELRTLYYSHSLYKELHRNETLIDDTMSCMGCCFFMQMDRFWELGGCDEGHGGWGQQGIEVALKAWLSGGSLKVNKKTWFSHWFRASDGGFPYHISGKVVDQAREYSKDLWMNDKWPQQKRKFRWLVKKFNPPSWDGKMELQNSENKEYDKLFLTHMLKTKSFPKWQGIKITKFPNDILLYQEIIFNNRPDFIIECGTNRGGSALFFANMFDLIGKGHVITIDKYSGTGIKGPFSGGIVNKEDLPIHPRITYLTGGSTAYDILETVKNMVGKGSVMASLDSSHERGHVKRELTRYCNIVTSGQYMVVEDTNNGEEGPLGAVNWFLKINKDFNQIALEKRFWLTSNPGGWLQKK